MSEKSSPGPDPIPAVSFSVLLTMFLRALYNAVKDFVRFLGRHKILIVVAILVGIAGGILKYRSTPSYYKVSMMVYGTVLTPREYGQMLSSLNSLSESGTYDLLSTSLRVKPEMGRKLRTIGGTNMEGASLQKDTVTKVGNPFIIQLTILDNQIADSLEAAIINYFNHNDYLLKLSENGVRLHTELLSFLNGELSRMDSLKANYNKSLAAVRDAGAVYAQSDKYGKERMETEEWLVQKRQPVTRIDGFKPSIVPSSTSMIQYIISYTLIFFLIGCLVGGLYEISRR
ncbi:MAG TPA: hypothetical protein VHD83_12315 [Puia sp.]|nr:hypothetical protein [Puia sp.]